MTSFGRGSESQSFLALGRTGKSSWWRYLCGTLLITVGDIIGSLIFLAALLLFSGGKHVAMDPITGRVLNVDPLPAFAAINMPDLVLIGCIWLIIRFLHKRSFLSLFTPANAISWRRIFFALGVWFGLELLNSVVGALLYPGTLQFNFKLGEFCRFLPFVLILTPIQCLSEELVFRAYLLQATAPLVKNQWLLAALNGFLFMIPHLWNPGVADDFVAMSLYFFAVGFLLAKLTICTNSLEVAIGTHAATNLTCALIIDYTKSPLHTSPIFLCTQSVPRYDLASFIVCGAIFYWLIVKYVRPAPNRAVPIEPA